MAKRNQSFENLSPEERNRVDGEKEMEIIKIIFAWLFIIIELILLFKVPVLAILLLIGYGKDVPSPIPSAFLKKKTDSPENNEKNKVGWKESGQKAAKKYVSRVTEAEVREKEFKSHPYTPVSYSYDNHTKENQLEQLRTLKNAGLLTEEEYKERRSSILAEK